MNYKYVVRDFAQRTHSNLTFIEAHVSQNPDAQLYEVTQLINSLLGLLVFPQQRFYDRIPPTPIQELSAQGWPNIQTLSGMPPCDNLRDLVRYLRNAIAHFNLEFMADPATHHITGLQLWNTYKDKETWRIQLTIPQLRQLAFRFIDLIEECENLLPSQQQLTRRPTRDR